MTIRFDGQVAIVTGSGRGLGKAYVTLLAARGASVIVHDAGVALDGTGFDPGVADAVVQEIAAAGGKAVPCYENIELHEGCLRLIDTALSQFSRLDILIHNAGWITFTPLEEMTPELLERVLNIQVKAPFWLSQAAFPTMQHHLRAGHVFGGCLAGTERVCHWENGATGADECPGSGWRGLRYPGERDLSGGGNAYVPQPGCL